jgi:hypothetical protein
MKNMYTLAILLFPLLTACNEPPTDIAENIVGFWRYDIEAVLERASARELTEQQRLVVEGVMQVYKDAIFDFRRDGMLVINSGNIEQVGSWKLSEDQKTLFLNISGYDQPNAIVEARPERLVLAADPEKQIHYDRIFKRAD